MGLLKVAEQLKKIAEEKAKEKGVSIQEAWIEAVKELDNIYKENEKE
ncbi:hypothetical protein [Faecalimicrobium sp. JNUCC 81]